MKPINLLFALAITLAPAFAMAHSYSHGHVEIGHPWSRPTPPGTPMGVGYLVITNHGTSTITLTGAETTRATRVSIHKTSMNDGMTSMKRVQNGLVIPAGETVKLAPQSYHLMLEQLKEPLKADERIPLTLHFDGADDMEVELAVDSLDAGQKKQEMKMDHSAHQHHSE
jgi:copper(I)-binding protein